METAFNKAFSRCPLIAILRGVRPEDVVAIGECLVDAGFTLIEVPLNSPAPLDSIARLALRLEGRAFVGAGTVLDPEEVDEVARAGGHMIVSPNADVRVVSAAFAQGLVSLPGFVTPTEAFAALDAGATALKLFPAEGSSPGVLKAMRAVLPPNLRIFPVGGITPDSMAAWLAAGADGFGLGSSLYVPGRSVDDVAARAREFVSTLAALRNTAKAEA